MKKIISLLAFSVLILLLAACGSESTSEEAESTGSSDAQQEEQSTEPENDADRSGSEASSLTTEEKQEQYEYTDEEFGTYFFLGAYMDQMESGEYEYTTVTFDNFTINVAPTLIEIDTNDAGKEMEQIADQDTVRAVFFEVETENDNDYDFTYDGNITLTTDDGEEVSAITSPNYNAAMDYNSSDYGEYGYFYFILNDASAEPQELEVTFEPPTRDGEPVGEAQTISLDNFIPENEIEM